MQRGTAAFRPNRTNTMLIIATDRFLMGSPLAEYLSDCTPPTSIVSSNQVRQMNIPADTTVIIDAQGVAPLSGFDVVRNVTTDVPTVRAVLIVESSSDLVLHRARMAGACGVASVWDSPVELRGIIMNARPGDFRVSAKAAPSADRQFTALLTARQLETYDLAARGLTDEEIACRLEITTATAETHRAAVFKRLNVHSHGDLALHALRHGALCPGEITNRTALRRCTRVHG